MIYILLSAIMLLITLLLVVEKNSKKTYSKSRDIPAVELNTPLMTGEDFMRTELLDTNKGDFKLEGEILNELYRIEGILGEGGMGKVYLCRNIKLGNLWAIKYIPKLEGQKSLPTLAEEDILKKLHHIYLPKIIDIFYDEKGTYIVESYIEGRSLDKKLKEEGPFPEEVVLTWLNHLTDALMYLHEMSPNPIIYRDMKPSNVMITPDQKAVLIDFGVSMELKGKFEIESTASTVAITPKFAAPEQFKGYADTRTDIYSLGVMVYYLLTGIFPHDEKPLKEQTTKISKEMMKILEKCLHKEMNKRYQTVKELKNSLNGLEKRGRNLFSVFKPKNQFHMPHDYKKIIITMGSESTGKTTVAVNMAWHLSEKKVKTILIDTDFINKDIYYYFNKDFANCLGKENGEIRNFEAEKINQYLSIYTDHRDVEVALTPKEILEIIYRSKAEAQVVIIDLGSKLEEKVVNDILSLVDHKILVVDQRVNVLNRIPKSFYGHRGKLQDLDIVINRFKKEGYISEKNIKGFFNNIEIGEDANFDIKINKIFRVEEDYLAILQALEERRPPVAIAGNKLKEGISRLVEEYYRVH